MAVNTISAFNKITAFQGLVWRFSCRFTDEFYIVTAETQSFNEDTLQFEPCSLKIKCKVPCQNDLCKPPVELIGQRKKSGAATSCKAIVKIVTCQTLKNFALGFKFPHVIVQVLRIYRTASGQEAKSYHVDILVVVPSRLPESFCLKRISSFSCADDLSDESSQFYVADGPFCIFNSVQNGTQVSYCNERTPEVITLSKFVPIVPYVQCKESTTSTKKPFSFKFISTEGNLVTDTLIGGSPQNCYFSSERFTERNKVCAMYFCGGSGAEKPTDLVLCSTDEMFYFQDGKLKQFVELPVKNPYKIMSYKVDSSCATYFLVLSRCGKVCAVDAGKFKVTRVWEDVADVLIDAFRSNGNVELLLLRTPNRDTTEEILHGAVITDIGNSINLQILGDNDASSSGSNYLTTALRGLESTLQAERALLDTTKLQMKQKTMFIKSTIAQLKNLAQNGDLPQIDTQPLVIDIPPKKRLLSRLTECAIVPSVESPFLVKGVTSRVVPIGWMLAVKLQNVSVRTLCSLQLHLSTELHSLVQYTTKEFNLSCKRLQSDQNEENLHRYHSNVRTELSTLLIAVVPMQHIMKLNTHGQISIAVTFCHCGQTDSTQELLNDKTCGRLYRQVLGSVPVKLEPVDFKSKPDNSNIVGLECIAGLREECDQYNPDIEDKLEVIVCRCMSLALVVPNGQSRHLACMLKEVLELSVDLKQEVMHWKPADLHINPVSICVHRQTADGIIIKVYYWYESELGLFLAVLKDRLPAILVLPDDSNCSDVPSHICRSLQKELMIVQDLSKKVKKVSVESDGLPVKTANVAELRTEFAEMQKRLEESRHCTVSLPDYTFVQKHRLEQEIITDWLVSCTSDRYYYNLK